MSSATTARKQVKASMMNAIHDLPLLVARDEGFFADQGLDVEIVKTPGTGQRGADHQALRDNIFKRTMESLYEQGECDQFRMCEWGIMKRAVESQVEGGHRPAKIVARSAPPCRASPSWSTPSPAFTSPSSSRTSRLR